MSEWISVKKRLPEENTPVLICTRWGCLDGEVLGKAQTVHDSDRVLGSSERKVRLWRRARDDGRHTLDAAA